MDGGRMEGEMNGRKGGAKEEGEILYIMIYRYIL